MQAAAAAGRRGLARALWGAAAGRRRAVADGRRAAQLAAHDRYHYSCGVVMLQQQPPSSTISGSRRRRRDALQGHGPALVLQALSPPKRRQQQLLLCTSSSPKTPSPSASSSAKTLVDRLPYLRLMRLDKPIGTWLLVWPGYWSIALAAAPGALPDPQLLALFGVGALVMRSAGCTVNDLWDRDVDKHVARTRDRPITSGEISVPSGVAFLGAQLLVGLGVLLQLNEATVLLGCASVPLVIAYPLMKRCMGYPQLVLGMTFNWGALMGWSAVHGSCAWPVVLPLYTAAVSWTVVYDTLYAHQDKKDDARLGLRSTALTFGEDTKPVLALFSGLTVAGLTVAGWQAGVAWPYYVGATGLTTLHLAWQLGTADLEDPANLAARFEANKWMGAAVFASAVAGTWLAA